MIVSNTSFIVLMNVSWFINISFLSTISSSFFFPSVSKSSLIGIRVPNPQLSSISYIVDLIWAKSENKGYIESKFFAAEANQVVFIFAHLLESPSVHPALLLHAIRIQVVFNSLTNFDHMPFHLPLQPQWQGWVVDPYTLIISCECM